MDSSHEKTKSDHCAYIKRHGDGFIILLLYIGDIQIMGQGILVISKLWAKVFLRLTG